MMRHSENAIVFLREAFLEGEADFGILSVHVDLGVCEPAPRRNGGEIGACEGPCLVGVTGWENGGLKRHPVSAPIFPETCVEV